MDEEELTRQDEERARRPWTPDQEEMIELDRRRAEVRKEIIALNMRLQGFDSSAPGYQHPPSEQEAKTLRGQIAVLREEEIQLTVQIDQLEAQIDEDAAK
jgi:hypothetical protein